MAERGPDQNPEPKSEDVYRVHYVTDCEGRVYRAVDVEALIRMENLLDEGAYGDSSLSSLGVYVSRGKHTKRVPPED